jgi:hypothetical protein
MWQMQQAKVKPPPVATANSGRNCLEIGNEVGPFFRLLDRPKSHLVLWHKTFRVSQIGIELCVGSHHEAGRMVANGRGSINGTVADPTTPVNDGDIVLFDRTSVALQSRALPRLFMLNEPLDVLVTN